MKVLMVNDWGIFKGGAETHISVLMDALEKLGVETELYIPSYIPFADKLLKFKPDVIHIHNWIYWSEKQDLIFLTGIPTVLSLHDYLLVCPKRMRLWPGHICATPCDKSCRTHFIALPSCKKVTFNLYSQGIFRAEGIACDVIPHGINLEKWPFGTGPRQGLGFVSADPGAWWKGEAVSRKIASRLDVPIKVLNGKGTPTEVAELMRSVEVLLYPAVYAETFGMVIAEGMASGTVLIAYDVLGGQKALVKHGETGYLVEPGDEMALLNRTQEVMRLNNNRIREAARQEIEAYYTAERMARDWEKLYHSLSSPVAPFLHPTLVASRALLQVQ